MAQISFKENAFENIPSVDAKTLRINLHEDIYGTFAEIGAGQETARHFFRAGASSGTIAKAMSAYDKSFSDAIYGEEEDKNLQKDLLLKTQAMALWTRNLLLH